MKRTLFLHLSLISGLILATSSTYAAGNNASMWGEIDKPVPSQQQIQQQQEAIQEQQAIIDSEKTICEIFTNQVTLTQDTANMAKIQAALQNAYKNAGGEFKFLLVNNDAANDLYTKYRNLYISTYCLAPGSPSK